MVSRISAERHRAHDRLGAEKTHLDVHLNVNLTVAAEFNMDISKPSQEDPTEIFEITLSMASLRASFGAELGMHEGVHIGYVMMKVVRFEKIRLQDADVNVDLASLVVEGKSSTFGRGRGRCPVHDWRSDRRLFGRGTGRTHHLFFRPRASPVSQRH